MSVEGAARQVAKGLVDRFGEYIDDKPVVRQVDDRTWAVAWEGVPSWAMNDPYDAWEEFASEMEEFGGAGSYNESDHEPYYDDIPGFWMEPYSPYVLHITRD